MTIGRPQGAGRIGGAGAHRLVLLLIRPSHYDDDGYVIRHWRGVLPSNTLNCLYSLTLDAIESGGLDGVHVDVHLFDEAVDRIVPRRLVRRHQRAGTRVVAALAGVQTNQFPRARDLALEFRRAGADVLIGGFHVSGAAAASAMPADCQALIDAGVTLVLGEVEGRWTSLLRAAAEGRLAPLYDFLADPPDLSRAAVPLTSPILQRKFVVRGTATVDASRGCPFHCSFCTIIAVQGRTMRGRDPACVIARVRQQATGRRPIRHYFFTDDNFARNPAWEAMFDGLIALRRDERLPIDFMMQVDIAAARIPRFVEKAARAGCVQVFIGLESVRDENLQGAGKRQNRVSTYRDAIARWHEAGIVCHVGYIIGFPADTYARVMEDVRALRAEFDIDQASFFMLTPLPGSADHRAAVASGTPLDPDYNRFDSFHAVQPHPKMSADEWTRAFQDAWREFYSLEHMERALLRQNPHTYWALFKVFLWYRAAMAEGAHPMVTGFFRRKRRLERRPELPRAGRIEFWRRRARDIAAQCRDYGVLMLDMHDLWRRTRIRRRDYTRSGLGAFPTRRTTPVEVKLIWRRWHAEGALVAANLARRVSRTARRRVEVITRTGALAAAKSGFRQAGRWSFWRATRRVATLPLFLRSMMTERY